MNGKTPVFKGQVVTIYVDHSEDRGAVLKDCFFETVGARVFLFGTGVDTHRKKDWNVGARIGVPWDRVNFVCLMTPEQYATRFK